MLERSRQQAAEGLGRRRHYPAVASGGSEVATSGETIPLCELRPAAASDWSRPGGGVPSTAADALRQLHAQSSAETSGVGDSLQRIHALSSTETSGFGGDPLQSPTDLASITSPSEQPRVPATTSVRSALPQYQSTVTAAAMSDSGLRRSAGDGGISGTQRYAYNGVASPMPHVHHRHYSPTAGRRHERHTTDRFDVDEDYYVDDDAQSTSSRGRYSRSRARHHGGDNGVGSGGEERQFLGSNTQSAWLRWSHERRASYRRKVEYMEKRQSDMERFRVSSPVRKARQESARLSNTSTDRYWFYYLLLSSLINTLLIK